MQKVAILGFGIEGQDAARYFLKRGAEITIFDKRDDILNAEWKKKSIKCVCGKNYLDNGLEGFDLIVRSPGFYRFHPTLVKAEKSGATITSTTTIFFEECKTPIIGVTGTKGKGTTARMIDLALKEAGFKTVLAGNIGEPMLSRLPEAQESDWVILELSSFQTIDLSRSPKIAVVTNITTDHMDWHKDRKEYVQAKEMLWKHQERDDFLVMNPDDKTSRELAEKAQSKVVWCDYRKELPAENLQVPGNHNKANACLAYKTALIAGADGKKAWKGIQKFKGTEHRLEKVAEVGGITYINDSAATHPESAIAALKAFREPKILILGGSHKGVKFGHLAKELAKNNVKAVILIGQTASEIEVEIKKTKYNGQIRKGLENMSDIAQNARKLATKGDIILLSPACASFGMFENYQDRGEQFKSAVQGLR